MRTNKVMTKVVPVLAALLIGGAANAEIKTVEVTAEVETVDGDKARTLERAKREARRMAVEQGAGTQVVSNTVVRDFEVVSDEIATIAAGVITQETWTPLKVEGATSKITLTAKVSPSAAQSAVCNILKQNFNPKIALVLVEKRGKENDPWKIERGGIETLIVNRLQNNCFTMVEPGVKVTEISRDGDLPQETIKAIVENADAEFVLLGSAKMIEANTDNSILGKTKMNSYSISANLKLVSVDTNTIVASSTGQTQVLGISPEHAMKVKGMQDKTYGVIDDVLGEIYTKVAEKWSAAAVGGSTVSVVVKNVDKYAMLKLLQKTVEKSFPEGNATKPRLKNKQATLTVQIDGGADEFAAQMEGKKVGKLSVEVLEVVRGKVVLQLN